MAESYIEKNVNYSPQFSEGIKIFIYNMIIAR
jgi:hypothetical protein